MDVGRFQNDRIEQICLSFAAPLFLDEFNGPPRRVFGNSSVGRIPGIQPKRFFFICLCVRDALDSAWPCCLRKAIPRSSKNLFCSLLLVVLDETSSHSLTRQVRSEMLPFLKSDRLHHQIDIFSPRFFIPIVFMKLFC